MKLNVLIEGSPDEIGEFLRLLGQGKASESILEQAFKGEVVKFSFEAGYSKAFSQVGWGTILLCSIVGDHAADEDGMHRVLFDDICMYGDFDDDEKVAARKISSRVGGLRKVTDRMGLEPVLEIDRIDGERYVLMPSAIKREVKEYLQYRLEEWFEWLNANNIDPNDLMSS